MSEDPKVETTETPTETVEPTQETPAKTVEELQQELDKAQRSLQNKEEEAKRVHAKLTKFEQAEEERKKAEMSEIDRLKADLEATQAAFKKAQHDNLKRDVAAKTGLPAVFADRLQGETPEALEADALALLEAIPKKTAPQLNPLNPSNTTTGETDAERRKRLLG